MTVNGAARTIRCEPDAPLLDVLRHAVALGAPLVAGSLARETECSWSDQLARLNAATSFAKAVNVTLAVRNAPRTFAASTHDCKRVAKEVDSAWLRFGPEPRAFDAARMYGVRPSRSAAWRRSWAC